MTTTFTCSQQFYADYCAPCLDKYRSDDQFVVTTSEGVKLFDVQLAMLKEKDVFSPVLGCDGKVIGFVVKDHPEYFFADTSGAGGDGSNAADIFAYVMQRLIEDGQKTSVFTYAGFRDVYVAEQAAIISE